MGRNSMQNKKKKVIKNNRQISNINGLGKLKVNDKYLKTNELLNTSIIRKYKNEE